MEALDIRPDNFVLIATNNQDREALDKLIEQPIAWLGLLASRRKVQLFLRQLREKGVAEEHIARLHAPVGYNTVLREVKVLKEMASQQGETMSGPLHIGLIPTVGPYLLPHIIPMLHQTFPKLEMYLHEAQTHQLLAQLDSGKLDCDMHEGNLQSEAICATG